MNDEPNMVDHPKHYTSGSIECIDGIRAALGHGQFRGYLRGNIMKYLWRYDKKSKRVQDLEKARWYLNYLIEYERNITEVTHDNIDGGSHNNTLLVDVSTGMVNGRQQE